MQKTRISLLGVNLLYLGILVGLIGVPMLIQAIGIQTETTVGQLLQTGILEIVLIGIPAFLVLWFGSSDRKAAFKARPLSFIDSVLVGSMAVTGYGFIIFVNLVWYAILSLIGEPMGQEVPAITTAGEFWLAVLTLGAVPALCEELLFRGVMLDAYESRLKWVPAILLIGVLFAAYHILLSTIPSIILLGVMITYTVYRTRSIWAGVLYHFTHNFLSVCLAYLQPKLVTYMEGQGMAVDMYEAGEGALLSVIIAWGIIGAFCLGLFAVFTWLLYYRTRDTLRPTASLERASAVEWLPVMLAGVMILYSWIIQIITMAVG
jgi:membrane protease YdiL (CAAX protease family)